MSGRTRRLTAPFGSIPRFWPPSEVAYRQSTRHAQTLNVFEATGREFLMSHPSRKRRDRSPDAFNGERKSHRDPPQALSPRCCRHHRPHLRDRRCCTGRYWLGCARSKYANDVYDRGRQRAVYLRQLRQGAHCRSTRPVGAGHRREGARVGPRRRQWHHRLDLPAIPHREEHPPGALWFRFPSRHHDRHCSG